MTCKLEGGGEREVKVKGGGGRGRGEEGMVEMGQRDE